MDENHILSDELLDNMMKKSPDDCDPAHDLHNNCCEQQNKQNDSQNQKDLIYLNVYIPELQTEQTVICSKHERIWNVKKGLIERCNNLVNCDLNYGFFCASFGHFLDEELTINHYFGDTINKCCNRIRVELLYKQRIKVGEVMSTLPPASTTRRRRKRTRLMSAVQNGNIEKVTKILLNCDPNFVDESSGDTPLSFAATSQSATTSAVQRIIVGLVNGGALLDFRTKDGRTALHCAVQKSNYVALKTLLDLGASPNYMDSMGQTALYYSIINNSNPKLTQLLLHEHSVIGVVDQHGWQEVHHACKLGLVAHLEQLLYYGCDMNCRIVGSGNTPLHVAAINDQLDCARVLLLRGCDTAVTNNSHQNAYQVAVIAGNMSLAELISNHKPEMVVPYRDKPKYNPARRVQHTIDEHSTNNQSSDPSKQRQMQTLPKPCPSSPSLSGRSCATSTTTTTTSSGVCCEDGSQSDGADEGEDESSSEDESSVRPVQLLPGMTVCAVADYNSGDPTHLALRRNDMIVLLPNVPSPPTIANQKLLLGRRCLDGKEGLFPMCCVEKVKTRVEGRRDQKYSSTTLPARGRSHQKHFLKNQDSASGAANSGLYHERTVTLQRGSKGFGFVLRGAKSLAAGQIGSHKQSLIGLQYLDEIEPLAVAEAAGLKRGDFLLAVNGQDVRHMSHENVVQLIRQSGDRVTMTVATPIASTGGAHAKQFKSILKKTDKCGDGAAIVDQLSTSVPNASHMSADESQLAHKFSTLPRNSPSNSNNALNSSSRSTSRGRAPPQPPKRDPTTTLSIGRARARSLLIPNSSGQSGDKKSAKGDNDYDSEGRSEGQSSSPTTSIESMIVNNGYHQSEGAVITGDKLDGSKVASIRSRQTRRISSYELQEFFERQTDSGGVKSYESMTALKKKKKAPKLHKNFNSTPDIQLEAQLQQAAQHNLHGSHHLSNSEEKLVIGSAIYAQTPQTLALRGGKIIGVNSDECPDKSRGPAPAYPPPPPPPPPGPGLQTSVIKLTLSQTSKQSASDYANYESVQQNQQMLSSFRPVGQQQSPSAPNSEKSGPPPTKGKAPAPPPGSQLKAARQPSTRPDKTSVYTRQDTAEAEQELSTPHIPDPDYWSDEEQDMERNTDMSTFRTGEDRQRLESGSEPKTSKQQSDSSARTALTARSGPTSVAKPTADAKPQLVSKEELRAQTQKIMSKSMNNTVDRQSNNTDKSEKPVPTSDQTDDSDGAQTISKVRKNIREFERRSSICSEAGVPAVVSMVVKKETCVGSGATNNTNTNSNNQSIRMSKSCFEVDCCDNSSSGVSSEVDGECGHRCDRKDVQMGVKECQQIRNKAQNVSEKIAHIIRSSINETSAPPTNQQVSRSMPTGANTMGRNVGHSGSLCCAAPATQHEHYTQQTRRTASVCEDQHRMVAHHNHPVHTLPAKSVQSAKQAMSAASKPASGQPPPSQPTNTQPIRLQIDSLGLAAVNEVDVLAELVPPPPEFAAPPPGHPLAKGQPVSVSMSQLQALSQQRQQQLQDMRHKQMLRQSLAESHAPPIPSQPPPATLPHLTQTREQIRIISPTPVATAQHAAQHYQRIGQQVIDGRVPINPMTGQRTAHEFGDLLARQRAAQVRAHQQQIEQQISASMRLGVNTARDVAQQQALHKQFATLNRHVSAHSQAVLSQQPPSAQQQQFATLTRAHPQAMAQSMGPTMTQTIDRQSGSQRHNYCDYTRLTVQNRLMRHMNTSPVSMLAAGGPQSSHPVSQPSGAIHSAVPPFARKPLSEWSCDDVQQWLRAIGMSEHSAKFEYFNGHKMMRLDNNSLIAQGVRQQQHRIYLLEKLKQQLIKHHQ